MITSSNRKKHSTAAVTTCTTRTLSACAALLGLAAAVSAQAHAGPLSIVTNESPTEPGQFSLDFGGGNVTRSNITSTTYELAVDPAHGTARFVSYHQIVQPLTLPGGLSTGDITVEIVDGTSVGTYDPLTKTFTTSEMYAVHFTGDLSAFGLTSPVHLPSNSNGQLLVDPSTGGAVDMDWAGVGQLSNPFDPANPLTFHYVCAVNTVFLATPANMVGLSLTPDVLALQLPDALEGTLVRFLDQSLARIQRGKESMAVHTLRAFIEKVNVLRGSWIDEGDADDLVADALATIELIGRGKLSVGPGGFHQRF